MNIRQEIKLHAELMAIGETIRVICPACRGGHDREKSLTITLFPNLIAKFNCFRDKCGTTKGSVNLTNTPTNTDTEGNTCLNTLSKAFKPKEFDGTTTQLTTYEEEWIENHWRIFNPPYWYHTNEYGGRVAMSVRSPRYTHRGWVLRDIKGTAINKALTYVEEGHPPMSWYTRLQAPNIGTIVVEDIPSAVRASKWITRAVALLGTGCGPERAAEIALTAQRPILVALDQDATKHACDMVERHHLLWGDQTKVVPLKQDLKDMTEEALCDLIRSSV